MLARRRDDLRKAALKANMARRKAQVRGREQADVLQDTGPADGVDQTGTAPDDKTSNV